MTVGLSFGVSDFMGGFERGDTIIHVVFLFTQSRRENVFGPELVRNQHRLIRRAEVDIRMQGALDNGARLCRCALVML